MFDIQLLGSKQLALSGNLLEDMITRIVFKIFFSYRNDRCFRKSKMDCEMIGKAGRWCVKGDGP